MLTDQYDPRLMFFGFISVFFKTLGQAVALKFSEIKRRVNCKELQRFQRSLNMYLVRTVLRFCCYCDAAAQRGPWPHHS
jgi:hypothetical protein